MTDYLKKPGRLKNYAVFFTRSGESKKWLRYLRAQSDSERRSEQINDYLGKRYPGYIIHEVRELLIITSVEKKIVMDSIFGKSELFSTTDARRARRMRRKIDGVIEEMKIRNPNINLGCMIHDLKVITFRVIFKLKNGED